MNPFLPGRHCMTPPTTDFDPAPEADVEGLNPYSDGEATILARFFGRTLAVTGDVARAASRGTFAVI